MEADNPEYRRRNSSLAYNLICSKASDLSQQVVSHFFRYDNYDQPYCVFCHQTLKEVSNRNSEQISLKNAKLV